MTLRKLAADCNFETPDPTTRLYDNSTMLLLDVIQREKIVCGLHDVYIQQCLITEQDLSLKTACDVALCVGTLSSSNKTYVSGR